jgi:hypothetical protein
MTRAIQLAFFALALCFTTPNLHAQRLHTVAVGDLSPSAGWGKYTAAVAMDLTNVWILVSENMPERGMDFSRLKINTALQHTSSTPYKGSMFSRTIRSSFISPDMEQSTTTAITWLYLKANSIEKTCSMP